MAIPFTPEDWDQYKEVRITPAGDYLRENGAEVFSLYHMLDNGMEYGTSTISFGYYVLQELSQRRLSAFVDP